jgi:WD40 repeat protein/basic membrane lipoprotein Med (substrate-binding protein (PBP1-ABC) superfamily)/DNA-binding SARP family transcriptional activator
MLRVYCLGQFQITYDNRPVVITSRPAQSLFAYLLLNKGVVHRREKLAGIIWPDASDENARAYLRQGLWRIRKALDTVGAAWSNYLSIDDISASYQPQADTFLDVAFLLEQKLESDWSTEELVDRVQMYTGELLPGFYDEWIILDREHLRSTYDQKMKLLLNQLESGGFWEEILSWSERWITMGHVPEPAYRGLLIAHGAQGNTNAVHEVFQRFQLACAEELGTSPSDEMLHIYEQLLKGEKPSPMTGHLPYGQAIPDAPPTPGPTPYKGLESFDANDSSLFYGRENLTAHLFQRLKQAQILVVVGASGSGKSSLIHAGLIPAAIHSGEWQIGVMTPTASPLRALSNVINRSEDLFLELFSNPQTFHNIVRKSLKEQDGGRYLLVVDQFEEIFTLCQDEREIEAFLNILLASKHNGAASIVIILRADFYAECGRYPALRDALTSHQEYIGPMSAAELRSAIEQPAQRAGWYIQPGLVDLIVREVHGEPGALPLLSHALLETWKRRNGRWMTLKGYAEAAGVHGAIARTAERVYNRQLNVEQQIIARSIFLRLSELSEDMVVSRRRASAAEFQFANGTGTQVEEVLHILANARLVTLFEQNVELAHEALISEWPRLRQWLEEDRQGLRMHHQLAESARIWNELDRDPGELYRGARLTQAVELSSKHPSILNPLEQEFLQASIDAEQQLAVEKELQQQRELDAARHLADLEKRRAEEQSRSNRRLWIFSIGISFLFTVTLIAAWIAVDQRNQANRTAYLAHARELSAAAINHLDQDPQLSILLALEAVRASQLAQIPVSPDIKSALHHAVRFSRQKTIFAGHSGSVYSASFSPDGLLLATASEDETVKLWDVEFGLLLDMLEGHQAQVMDVRFHPNGRWLASTSRDHSTRLWDLEAGRELWSYRNDDGFGYQLVFSPGGDYVSVVMGSGWIIVLNLEDGTPIHKIKTRQIGVSIAYSQDGTSLAFADIHGSVQLFDAKTGEEQLSIHTGFNSISHVAFNPNKEQFAVASYDGSLAIWDLNTQKTEWSVTGQPGSGFTDVDFSPDGRYLITAGFIRGAQVWDTATGQEMMTFSGHEGVTYGARFNAAGDQIVTSSQDRTARTWDFSPPREVALIASPQGTNISQQSRRIAYSPDSRLLAAGEGDHGAVVIWDADTGIKLRVLQSDTLTSAVASVDFHPDGQYLVSADIGGEIAVWNPYSGELITQWTAHDQPIGAVRFSPSGGLLISSGLDSRIKYWNVEQNFILEGVVPGWDPLFFLAANDDHSILLQTYWGILYTIDPRTGQNLGTYRGQIGKVSDAVFSHNGQLLAAADFEGDVVVYESASERKISTFSHTTTHAIMVAFHPDEPLLATVGLDGSLRLWDVTKNEQILLLENASGKRPNGVVFSPDGRKIAVSSEEGISVYLVELADLIELASSRLTRNFSHEECLRYAITSSICLEIAAASPEIIPEIAETDRLLACFLPDLGGINLNYFHRLPYQGMNEAAALLNWDTLTVEPILIYEMNESHQRLQRSNCDLIILSTFEDVTFVDMNAPHQRYIFVSGSYPEFHHENLWNVIYLVEEPSFLAGYLAAAVTNTGVVGVFGGGPFPFVDQFMEGFTRGVNYYNQENTSDVDLLLSEYVPFNQPEVAAEVTQQMIAQGADIIFPVAGEVNMRAVSDVALAHDGVLVIGVDQDWSAENSVYASITLTSVVKKLDKPVFWAMEAITNGVFSGGLHQATLENGGVNLAPFYQFEPRIPEQVKIRLEELKRDIIVGKIELR